MEHTLLHIILLITAVTGLFFSFLIKSRNVRLLAAFFLILSAVPYISQFSQTNLLHVSVEWIIVSLLMIPVMKIKASKDKMIYFSMVIIICFIAHCMLPTTYHSNPSDLKFDPDNEILMEFEDRETLELWIAENEGKYDITYPVFAPLDASFKLDEFIALNVEEGDTENIIERLSQDPNILHVEYNEIYQLKLPESTPFKIFKSSKSINDPQIGKQWMAKEYDLEKFHKSIKSRQKTKNSKQTIIAILDTGIDAKHEDLKDNYKSIAITYDKDPKGHGTHCAGIAAAVTGNKIGIASWIPPDHNIKVTSVTVLNSLGMGTQRTIINGILKAADSGADVISLSLGGRSSNSREKAYNEAVNYANAKGAIVVVAAGNSNSDASKYSPANTKGAITVAAVDTFFRKADFSNTISNVTNGIYAPGTAIYSTMPNNQYQAFNGTSMAAPFVSGIIGLMKHYDPTLSTENAFYLINQSAIKKNGIRIIDPNRLMQAFFNQNSVPVE